MNTAHNSRQFAGNIFKYYLYTSLGSLAFGLPMGIWVIYLIDGRGLSLSQVTLVEALFWIVITVSEVPTGIVADVIGRKQSLICGVALIAISMLIWSIAATIPLLMLTYLFWGVGSTFRSGAQDALLYESLKADGRTSEYARINGRVMGIETGAFAIGVLLSGPIASLSLVLPIQLSAILFVVLLGVTLTFKEPPNTNADDTAGVDRYKKIVRASVKLIRTKPTLRHAILYMTFVPIAFFIVSVYFLQPQSLALGIPLVAIGLIGLGVQVANIIGLTWSQQLENMLGTQTVMYLVPLLLILSLVISGLDQSFAALLIIGVMGFLTGIIRPSILNIIQAQVDDDVRATVLSMQSLITTGVQVVVVPTLGIMAERSTLSAVYFGNAGLLAMFFLYLFLNGREHFPHPIHVQSNP